MNNMDGVDQGSHHGDHQDWNQDQGDATFGFPILDITRDIVMKNIHPSILAQFHGLHIEYPDAFLFEFDILCRRTIIILKIGIKEIVSYKIKRLCT